MIARRFLLQGTGALKNKKSGYKTKHMNIISSINTTHKLITFKHYLNTGMKNTIRCFVLLALGLASCNRQEQKNIEIPFDYDTHIYLSGTINDSIQGHFMFDT